MKYQARLRGRLLSVLYTTVAAAFLSAQAVAQEEGADVDDPEAEDQVVETIIVTGSKVVTGADSVSPVVVIDSERLVEVPRASLNDFFVADVTQNIGIITEVENGGQSGRSRGGRGASLNIRGLGEENTLVLVNGVRTIEYAAPNNEGWRSVDINGVMPSIAVKRIEMLLDGGSAIYGTDAVAGVVNLIPDYEFKGLKLNYGADSFQGAPGNRDDSLGVMFGGGSEKTSIIAAFDYRKQNPPTALDDSDSRITLFPGPGDEEWLNVNGISSAQFLPIQSVTMMGVTSVGLGNQVADLLCGQTTTLGTAPLFAGILGDDYVAQGGTLPDAGGGGGMGMGMGGGGAATPVADDGCFEYANASGANTARNTENLTAMIALQHEFSDRVRLSMEYSFNDQDIVSPDEWARNRTFLPNEDQSLDPDGDGVIFNDPDAPGYIISANHPAIQYYNQLWQQQNPGADPATNPWANPDGYVPLLYATNSFRDSIADSQLVDAWRFGTTLNIALSEKWEFQVGGVLAKHMVDSGRLDRSEANLNKAIRGFGGPNCDEATGTPGAGDCMYWNPTFSAALPNAKELGLYNEQSLRKWIYPESVQHYSADFSSVTAAFVGSLGWELGGGPVAMAVGIDWRKDELTGSYPDRFNDGTSNFTGGSDDPNLGSVGNPINDYHGETTATGVLLDVNLPFSENFNVQVAGRYEDFDSGNGYSSFNPKIGFNWQLTDKLIWRASFNTAFRAPTINHFAFFESLGTTSQSFLSPDSPGLVDGDPATDPDSATYSVTVAEIRVPNPDLQPQESKAFSTGILWQASDNFSMDLTYTQIELESIIFALNSGQTLELSSCQAGIEVIPANPPTGEAWITIPVNGENTADPLRSRCYGYIDGSDDSDWRNVDTVFLRFQNQAQRNIEAIDFTFRFNFETAIGDFSISPGGTYNLKYEESDLETDELIDYVGLRVPGQFGSGPSEWRVNMPVQWNYRNHGASLTGRWISALQTVGRQPGDPKDADYYTVDFRYAYRISDNMSLSAYVTNLANTQPDNTRGNFPVDRRRIGFQFSGTWDSDMFMW